jgi:hypothetical protein
MAAVGAPPVGIHPPVPHPALQVVPPPLPFSDGMVGGPICIGYFPFAGDGY